MSLILIVNRHEFKEYICSICGTKQIRHDLTKRDGCFKCLAVREHHEEEFKYGDL